MEIIIHGMYTCERCDALEIIFDILNIKYTLIVDNLPKFSGEYPHIFIDGNKLSYKNVLQKIRNGDIK